MKRVFLLLVSAAFALPLSAREVQGAGKNSGAANSGSMKTVEELWWGTGDSEMPGVIRNCDVAAECSTLKQLERVIDDLLVQLNS